MAASKKTALTFPRIVIVGSLLGSLVTGWLVYQKKQEVEQLNRDVKEAPIVVQAIQMKAIELDQLLSAANKEGLKGDVVRDMEFYIRQKASDPGVNLGQVETSRTSTEQIKGVEDVKYAIRPKDKSQRARRGAIANFLYTLERDSRRVKVTSLKLTPADRMKPGDIGNDTWKFEAEITSRRLVDKG